MAEVKERSLGHKYIPILKTKAGEKTALRHIGQELKRDITPLFEFHTHRSKDVLEHVDSICVDFADAMPDMQMYLDCCWLPANIGDHNLIAAIFESARNANLNAVPVVTNDLTEQALAAVNVVNAEDGRGCLIRLSNNDLESLDGIYQALELDASEVDLLVEFNSWNSRTLVTEVNAIPNIADWRNVTVATGQFPRSMAEYPKNEWFLVERSCWHGWMVAINSGHLSRKPGFGDFTMRDPGAPAEFGDASANLRYAIDEDWLCYVGGKVKEGHSDDMYDICRELIQDSRYRGPDFSYGDGMIHRTATVNNSGPGNAQSWVQWCINHHITQTVRQIQDVS